MIINIPLNIPDEMLTNTIAKDYEAKITERLYEKLVRCKNCKMVYPWCHKFRNEFGGNGFCPYGAEIIEKRAACDREDTDCILRFKESHFVIDPEILQKAVENTVKLIDNNTRIVE